MFMEPTTQLLTKRMSENDENQLHIDIKIDTSDVKTSKLFGEVLTFKLKNSNGEVVERDV